MNKNNLHKKGSVLLCKLYRKIPDHSININYSSYREIYYPIPVLGINFVFLLIIFEILYTNVA